jgi:hypothetical protein
MSNTILVVVLILFGVSAVFRFITHILEIKDRDTTAEDGVVVTK